jgi:hypothetical protein
LYADVPVIIISGNADSPLAELADVFLHTGGAPEVCPLGLTPTTSTTVMTVIGGCVGDKCHEGYRLHSRGLCPPPPWWLSGQCRTR